MPTLTMADLPVALDRLEMTPTAELVDILTGHSNEAVERLRAAALAVLVDRLRERAVNATNRRCVELGKAGDFAGAGVAAGLSDVVRRSVVLPPTATTDPTGG